MTLGRLFAALSLAAVVVAAAHGAAAQEVTRGIAILDMKHVLGNATAVRDIRDQVRAYIEAYRAETEAEDKQLREAEQELARKRPVLAPEAFSDERRKLEQRVLDARGRVEQRKRALNVAQNDAMREVQTALNRVVTEIAQEQSILLILSKENAILVAKTLEVTDAVLERLNQQLPTVTVPKPGQ